MKPESIDDILTMLLRGLVFLENDLKKKILVEKYQTIYASNI